MGQRAVPVEHVIHVNVVQGVSREGRDYVTGGMRFGTYPGPANGESHEGRHQEDKPKHDNGEEREHLLRYHVRLQHHQEQGYLHHSLGHQAGGEGQGSVEPRHVRGQRGPDEFA